jgi:site-specific DNA-cytosine methylase
MPDDFTIEHGWASPIKQLGNAVPVQVGQAFGNAMKTVLERAQKTTTTARSLRGEKSSA